MNNNLEIDGTELTAIELARPRSLTPMDMIQVAVQRGASLEEITKLMDLQERVERNEARRAYVTAMNAFKAQPPTLTKNKHVKFGNTEYDHATLDNVVDTITQGLSAHGLSHSWKIEQADGRITVTCVLTHELGHSESVSMEAGADSSGSKNGIQAIASAVTYLQRYTLLSATGMAAKEADDDGFATASDVEPILQAASIETLQSAFTAAYKKAKDAKNNAAMKQIIAAKDQRKAELAATPKAEPAKPKAAKINADQVTRFQTIASKSGASEEDRHRVLWNVGRYESSKDITTADYDALCTLFRTGEWSDCAGEKKA